MRSNLLHYFVLFSFHFYLELVADVEILTRRELDFESFASSFHAVTAASVASVISLGRLNLRPRSPFISYDSTSGSSIVSTVVDILHVIN